MSDDTKTPSPSTLDLSSLRFTPDWVSDLGSSPAPTARKYADFDEEPSRDRDRGDRRREGGRRPERAGNGDRREGRGDRPRGDRLGMGAGGPRRDERGPRVDDRPQLPTGLKITVEPEDKALDMLAQHVKTQPRAFSLFDAARLILAGPERHRLRVHCEAERLVGLFQVPADGSLFETREEAVRHLLKNTEALAELYKVEEVELEEPKGNFTSIGICGVSGEILGPPSHHSFQTTLKRLHNERFSHLPFEEYRRRVKVENTPEIVEKWKEQQRRGMRWIYLKDEPAEGAEPLSFSSRSDFEAHFRRTHAESAVTEAREAIVHATVTREQLSPGLGRLLRRNVEDAKKHLFELSQKIAHGLERRGLKLFKRRSGKMFVSRVKPKAMDPDVVLSERIASIVALVRETPGIELSHLLVKLAPDAVEAETAAPEAEATEKKPTDEQLAVLRDLHWLADAGFIIIYSDNVVFLGVQGESPAAEPGTGKSKAKDKAEQKASDETQGTTELEAGGDALEETADDMPKRRAKEEPVSESLAEEVDTATDEDTSETLEEESEATSGQQTTVEEVLVEGAATTTNSLPEPEEEEQIPQEQVVSLQALAEEAESGDSLAEESAEAETPAEQFLAAQNDEPADLPVAGTELEALESTGISAEPDPEGAVLNEALGNEAETVRLEDSEADAEEKLEEPALK